MHARVMNFQVQDGKMEEFLEVIRESVEPILHHLEGFQAGFVFTNQENNSAMSVSIWETEEQMLANERSPIYVERISRMTARICDAPTPIHYEAPILRWFGPAGERAHP